MNKSFIPFHKPFIDENEISEVVDTLKSGWLTSGPKALKFEEKFRDFIGCKYAVAVSSWTAAAHLALEAIGIKKDDEVIVPSLTFTSTAEIVCYFGAKPVIVDVQKDTFNINPDEIKKNISKKTRAIIPVHYSGQPCDMDEIKKIADENNLKIIEDAAHALPAFYKGSKIGNIGNVTCFSFYSTKTLATGEGGMICTDSKKIAERCRIMRLHGINKDAWKRYTAEGSWFYEVVAPGYKYNFTDIQAALGLSQLKKVNLMYKMRSRIAKKYDAAFSGNDLLEIYKIKSGRSSAYHLYPVLLKTEKLKINRAEFINKLKEIGVGSSVHFIPLYRHPFYKKSLNLNNKNFPVSEYIYPRIITLPIWPGMSDENINRVISSVNSLTEKYAK